jgi:tagatose 6-phosphate kinase
MNPSKILCLGTTPAVQRVMIFRKLALDAVNRATTTLDGAAGKSVNVAKVLKALGEQPIAMGFLGGDRGEFLRTALVERGIESDFVTVSTRTRQCITVIDESAGTQSELVEESQPVEPADFVRLMAIIRRHVPECRAMVMSGTIVTGGPVNLYFDCTQLTEIAGAFTVVDAQGAALIEALKAEPGLIKPNRSELAATVGRELGDDADVMKAMRELIERGAQRVVVTAGKEPTLAFDGKHFWRIVSPQIRAVNPIGSGDAFTAGLVSRLMRGDDLGEACRWGSAAGAANALTMMTGEVNRVEVERFAPKIEVQRI